MITEEMIKELEKDGYAVKKISNTYYESRWATEYWNILWDYIPKDRWIQKDYVRSFVRNKIKKYYGYRNISEIPDYLRCEVGEFMIREGKQYIDEESISQEELEKERLSFFIDLFRGLKRA